MPDVQRTVTLVRQDGMVYASVMELEALYRDRAAAYEAQGQVLQAAEWLHMADILGRLA